MLTVTSISDKSIRLTNERWLHILEGHPELAGHLDDVLLAIAAPEIIVEGGAGELIAALHINKIKWLIVVYKENEVDGFVITAYFTSKIGRLLKRKKLWQK